MTQQPLGFAAFVFLLFSIFFRVFFRGPKKPLSESSNAIQPLSIHCLSLEISSFHIYIIFSRFYLLRIDQIVIIEEAQKKSPTDWRTLVQEARGRVNLFDGTQSLLPAEFLLNLIDENDPVFVHRFFSLFLLSNPHTTLRNHSIIVQPKLDR